MSDKSLSEQQIDDLAGKLVGIIEDFYRDPKNEGEYQKWLLSVEKESIETSS